MKSMLTAAVTADSTEDRQIAALLTHLGPKIKYDASSWFTWTGNDGWVKGDGDPPDEVRTALRAAASNLKAKLKGLAHDGGVDFVYNRAIGRFRWRRALHPPPAPSASGHDTGDEQGRRGSETPKSLALNCEFMPQLRVRESSFLSRLKPWVAEPGFAKSFETCHDIAFKNGVQEMTAPFRFRPETPDDRITNRFDCDLPTPPSTEEKCVALQEFALKPFKDVFIDHNVALRECDKVACLLTGTCAVLPEANIRPQIGPYNDGGKYEGQFAAGVGKDCIGNHMEAVFGENICTSWGTAMLSTHVEPDQNNHGFKGLEKHLGHWITDASATKRGDSDSLRKWGDLPKKLWAGGAPSRFPVTLKYKDPQLVLPRSNACYVSSQQYYVGNDTGIHRRIECSPYPRVANIDANLYLIGEKGVPCFEVNPDFVNTASNMTPEERGKHMRYMVDRAIAILKDPKAGAYPATHLHHAAKRQFLDVSVNPPKKGEPDKEMEEEMFAQLTELIGEVLIPCEPRGLDEHNEAIDLVAKRQKFQFQNPRCFHGKKAAKDACSFRVGQIASAMKGLPAFGFYLKNPTQLSKLTKAVQCALHLEETPIVRANGFHRDAIFGWCLKANDESKEADAKATAPEEASGESASTSTAAETGKKRKATTEEE
jgi:hypothetical protein